jgi:hypothetical protein
MEIIGDKATISEIAERVRRDQPAAFCIVSLVPRGPAQARLRYKRLRKLFPDLPIILAFWGGKPEEAHTNKQDNSGSDAQTKVTRSMLETLNVTVPLLRLALHRSSSERKIDRQEKAVTSTKL